MSDVLVINPDDIPLSPGILDGDHLLQITGGKLYKIPVETASLYFAGSGGGGGTTLTTPTLTVTPVSSSQINLSWTNVANESSYELQRSPNGSTGWTTISSPPANSTTHNDTGLTASTAYYYRVRAIGDGVTYLNSGYGTGNGTTSALGSTQLSTPGSFSASVISSSQINLSWTDVANESSYMLEWSPNGTSGWTQIGGTIAAGTTSYNHTGLTASTAYYYRLKAVGNGTTFTDSNFATANATTSASGGGLADVTFTAVTNLAQSGTVWTASAGAATGLAGVSLAPSTAGTFQAQWDASTDDFCVISLDPDNSQETFSGMKYGFYIQNATNLPRLIENGAAGGEGNGGNPITSISAGFLYRLRRDTGGTVYCEYSTNSGSSWILYHTFSTTDTSRLYLKVNCVNSGNICRNPKQTGAA